MSSKEALIALRTALVRLYAETNDARGVAQDAELNQGRIDFNGKIVNVWRSMLDEAEKSHKLGAVVQTALDEYPDDAVLLAVAPMFGVDLPTPSMPTPSAEKKDEKQESKYNITIQNGQGVVIGDNAQVTQHFGGQTNTSGGSYVAGNVAAGRDFVGRDQTAGPNPPTPPQEGKPATPAS